MMMDRANRTRSPTSHNVRFADLGDCSGGPGSLHQGRRLEAAFLLLSRQDLESVRHLAHGSRTPPAFPGWEEEDRTGLYPDIAAETRLPIFEP